jgi:hypothetical protein
VETTMANVPPPIRPTRNSAGPADREVAIDLQSPRGGGRRFARRLAVTPSDYDRIRARVKLSPGTGNAPANLGRPCVASWNMPGFAPIAVALR